MRELYTNHLFYMVCCYWFSFVFLYVWVYLCVACVLWLFLLFNAPKTVHKLERRWMGRGERQGPCPRWNPEHPGVHRQDDTQRQERDSVRQQQTGVEAQPEERPQQDKVLHGMCHLIAGWWTLGNPASGYRQAFNNIPQNMQVTSTQTEAVLLFHSLSYHKYLTFL